MTKPDYPTFPDATWNITEQVCYDPLGQVRLPNFAGLCLVTEPREMVMNTWMEGSTRRWELVCMGHYVPSNVLDDILETA